MGLGGLGLDHHDGDVAGGQGRPATDMSNVARSSSGVRRETDPLTLDERDPGAPTGRSNGRPEICVDADAALMATTS